MANAPDAVVELHAPGEPGDTLEVSFKDYVSMAFELAGLRAEAVALRAEVARLRKASDTNRRRGFRGLVRLARWLRRVLP